MKVLAGETLEVRGTMDLRSATLQVSDGLIDRAALTEEPLEEIAQPLTGLRVWNNLAALLPVAATSNDLGLVTAGFGTDAR